MASLASRHPKVQIISSSRIVEKLVDHMPFFAVTLLPFTDEQQSQFFDLWFGGSSSDRRRRIARHLGASEEIRNIVRSPLLATILCVLAERDIELPNSEIHLYEERMKLLTGYYDLFKQVERRIESHTEELSLIARKLAFALHSREAKSADRCVMYDCAIDAVAGKMRADACRLAVDELADPCNVLLPMPDGQLTFGHLRYQEFLAAQEISMNRAIDVAPLLSSGWWRGVFVLFAKMSEGIDWIVDLASERLLPTSSRATLDAMIAVRPRNERSQLTASLQLAYRMRSESRRLSDEYDDERQDDWSVCV